jgi:DNA mismatch repair ATPase MutS
LSSADLWRAAIECIAILDVLVAFAQYGNKEDTCMPVFEEPSEDAVVSLIIYNIMT